MMMVVTFILVAFAFSACEPSPLERIVGGDISEKNAWPWQLSLQYGSGSSKSHICGAVLVSQNFAVTAAHCVSHDRRASRYQVIAGEHDFDVKSGTEQEFAVDRLIMHPNYNEYISGFPNDIALLQLSHPAQLTNEVKLIKLPSETNTNFYNHNENCYISGWGRLSGNGELPNKLYEAHTTVISHSECQTYAGSSVNQNLHICVYTSKNGACNGDSGGPLMCNVNGEYELAGVTSWGRYLCPTSHPSVYTRVSNYIDWIRSNSDVM